MPRISAPVPVPALTQARLKELLHYDPVTGIFTWITRKAQRIHVGDVAGWANGKGYLKVEIDGRGYFLHNLAWLYMTGEWPARQVDHKNCVGSYNAWDNLREATAVENGANTRLSKRNTSGFKGVHFRQKKRGTKRWQAYIRKNRQLKHLGYFYTPEEAHAAYVTAASELSGEFARAG